jgi:serine/threonine-protein kinase RsbW
VSDRWDLEFTSPPDDVDGVQDFIERVWAQSPHVGDLDRMAFETALIELATNVIQHAGGEEGVTCVLTLSTAGDRIVATLSDTAEKGDVALVVGEMPDAFAESGRGLPMVEALVDTLEFGRVDDHNVWTIARSISPES